MSTTTYPIASLERRFYAFALDRLLGLVLVAAAGSVAWLATDGSGWPVALSAAGAAVLVWLVLSTVLGVTGASPGKLAAGLRVVHHGTGTPVGVGRGLMRSLVVAVSGIPTFGIGLATLAWTAVEDPARQRRGFHDQVGRSIVVDVRPVLEAADVVEDEQPRHIVNLTAMRLVPAPPVEATPMPPRTHTSEQSMRRQPLPPEAARPPAPAASPAPAAAPAARHVARQVPRWRVTFDDGGSFVVTGLALVGRRPEARTGEDVAHLVPLASADMSVSKTHAQFGPAPDGAIVVMDRGSTNGTALVRKGMTRQLAAGKPATLIDGDRVVFGDREMRLSREA